MIFATKVLVALCIQHLVQLTHPGEPHMCSHEKRTMEERGRELGSLPYPKYSCWNWCNILDCSWCSGRLHKYRMFKSHRRYSYLNPKIFRCLDMSRSNLIPRDLVLDMVRNFRFPGVIPGSTALYHWIPNSFYLVLYLFIIPSFVIISPTNI